MLRGWRGLLRRQMLPARRFLLQWQVRGEPAVLKRSLYSSISYSSHIGRLVPVAESSTRRGRRGT